nr:transposase [Klebsiella grimontii]
MLFTVDDAWNLFLVRFRDNVTPWTRLCVERMLACGTASMGVRRYCCASADCPHSRFFCQSCKSKACSACGFKATEQWVSQQSHILPDCDWQHITFTMPHLLWPFFNNNWPLLNALFRAATRAMLRWARKQGLEVGIFCALHTYGRQLNQHPHIHLSVTRGGLDIKHGIWRDIFFKKHAVEKIWRGAVTRLLRHSYDLINPGGQPGLGHIRDKKQWQRYLQAQYGRRWKVHFAKKTRGAWRSVKYLGRYLKRPPVSAAKLRRYYGFLSNRKRGELLPKVYEALEMEERKKPEQPGFSALMKAFLRTDPYKCILCGNRLRFVSAQAGSHAAELVAERLHNIDRKRWLLGQTAG